MFFYEELSLEGSQMVKINTYEKLIDEYKECAHVHYNIDYADENSVICGNNAVKTMIDIAKSINNMYPEKIEEFSFLLFNDKDEIDIWVAHHILEYMNYTSAMEHKALSIIKKYARKNTIEGLGNRMWLKEWQKNKK